jgi:hypothetical protein
LDFQSPGSLAPYTEIVTGGLPPYSASSSNTAVATVAQGISNNLISDADTLANHILAGGMSIVPGDGPNGAVAAEATATGSPQSVSAETSISVASAAGAVLVFSCWLNPQHISVGAYQIFIESVDRSTLYGSKVNIGNAGVGRYSVTAQLPAGVTQCRGVFTSGGATVNAGSLIKFSQPMVTVQGIDYTVYQSPTSVWIVTPKYRGSAIITYSDSTP